MTAAIFKLMLPARLSLAVVFAVALGLRLVAVWTLGGLPLSRTPQLDSLEYLLWAGDLASGRWTWPEYPAHAPGYPLFLAAGLALTGGSLTAIRIVQAVLGAIGCVLTARIAARTLRPDAGLPAGLLQAVYAPLIYLDTALLAEPLMIVLSLFGVDLATRASARRSRWVWAGAAFGAAAIVRPTALVLIPACAAAWWWQTRGARRAPAVVAALAAGAALIVLPVVVQNWRITGVPLIQAYGGMHLYLGNTPDSDGAARARLGGSWDRLEGEASRAGTSRNAQDRYFLDKTLQAIAASPVAYGRLLASKAAWMVQEEDVRDTHSYYFFREALPLLRWLPGFGLLFSLAAVGALTLRQARAPAWIVCALVMLAATVVFLLVGLRYRAPLVPFVAMLAGAGAVSLAEVWRARSWRPVVARLAVFGLALASSQVRTDPATRNLAEEWAFTGLSLAAENRLASAEEAYRRAIALDERSSYAWDGLGLVLQRNGQTQDARAAFERAVAIAPQDNAVAWFHLGVLRDRLGEHDRALDAYRYSLHIAPERTDVILQLGLTLHRLRQFTEAEPLLTKAAARGEGRAHFALALMAIDRRDRDAARRHAADAVRLLPGYQPARELLVAVETAR